MKTNEGYLVVQQGGSSSEVYLHTFDTYEQARNYRRSCERAAYNTSKPVRIPAELEQHLAVVEEIVQQAVSL